MARRQVLIEAAQLDTEMRAEIDAISAVILGRGVDDPEAVVVACLRLAGWAESLGRYGTALAFAQSAALVVPDRAALAYEAGRLAIANGEVARGDSWLRRAVGLARRTEDWPCFCHGLAELGALNERQGAHQPRGDTT